MCDKPKHICIMLAWSDVAMAMAMWQWLCVALSLAFKLHTFPLQQTFNGSVIAFVSHTQRRRQFTMV